MSEHGFGPRFGVEAFDLAAARLALDGSAKALRACVEAKIDPAIALAPDPALESDPAARHAPPPFLARCGGLEAQPAAAKTWAKAKDWIDRSMGPGSADAMVHDAAVLALREWRPSADAWNRREAPVAKALAWLDSLGPARPTRAASELALFQGIAIELAEASPANPRPESAALSRLMDQWSAAVRGPAPPRRLLKA